METILIAFTPIVVALLSQGVKKVTSITIAKGGFQKQLIRFAVAVLSYFVIIGGAILTGGEVDMMATETFAATFITFLGATGTYFFFKKK